MTEPTLETRVWTERLLFALRLLAPLLILVLIARYAVNVPFHDEWGWSVRRVMDGRLLNFDLAFFWRLNNEHRVFVPTLLGAALGHLTNLDMRAPILAKWALTVCSAIVLTRIAQRGTKSESISLGPLLLTLWLFSFSQWPRWVDVRPLPSTLSILSLSGALWVVSTGPKSWKRLLIAMACAWISSSSYFSGNMTWVVVGIFLVLMRWGLRAYVVWFLCAGLVATDYLIDYWQTPTPTSLGGEKNASDLVRFVLIFLGASCSSANRGLSNQIEALLYGLSGIVAFFGLGAAMLRRSREAFERSLPWLAIGAWVLLNAVATAYGRLPTAGLAGARAWRYSVFSALFWAALSVLATYALFDPTAKPRSRSRSLALGTIIVLAMGLIGGAAGMLDSGGLDGYPRKMREGRASLLLEKNSQPRTVKTMMPDVKWFRKNLPALIERKASFLYGERAWRIKDGSRHNSVQVGYRSVNGQREAVFNMAREASIGWLERILDRPYAYVHFRLASRMSGHNTHFSVIVQKEDSAQTIMECNTSAGLAERETFRVDVSDWIGQEITLRFRCESDSKRGAYLLTPRLVYDVLERDPQ